MDNQSQQLDNFLEENCEFIPKEWRFGYHGKVYFSIHNETDEIMILIDGTFKIKSFEEFKEIILNENNKISNESSPDNELGEVLDNKKVSLVKVSEVTDSTDSTIVVEKEPIKNPLIKSCWKTLVNKEENIVVNKQENIVVNKQENIVINKQENIVINKQITNKHFVKETENEKEERFKRNLEQRDRTIKNLEYSWNFLKDKLYKTGTSIFIKSSRISPNPMHYLISEKSKEFWKRYDVIHPIIEFKNSLKKLFDNISLYQDNETGDITISLDE